MSCSSTIFEITPLLPWRPASLSPSEILRFLATKTRTRSLTPGGRSSPFSRENVLTSMTTPPSPCGTLSEVSRTSRAFSLKIARISFSSAVSSVSPFGVTLPTSRSPEPTSAPMRTMPRSSRLRSDSSERFGMSRVISSSPSFVVRASISYSSMWIEVSSSSLTSRRERMIASSKLKPSQDMKATMRFLPSAISPESVAEPSASTSPACTVWPVVTRGLWWMSVPWLERMNFCRSYSWRPLVGVDGERRRVDVGDRARGAREQDVARVERGAALHPGADDRRVGLQQRHRLGLHVRAHQRAVRVVVLEERDHRGRDRPDLLGRDVHEVDVGRRDGHVLAGQRAADDLGALELARLRVDRVVGLGDQALLLLGRVQVDDLVGDDAVLDDAVRASSTNPCSETSA